MVIDLLFVRYSHLHFDRLVFARQGNAPYQVPTERAGFGIEDDFVEVERER